MTLDIDGDLSIPVGNSYQLNNNGATKVNPFNTGFGVDARLGFRAGSGLVFVQPELVGGLQEFEWVNGHGFATSGASVGRFMAGARLGGRGIFEPQAYAHIGGAAGGYGISGFTYDIGGAANVRLRRVTFGVHASFNQIIGSNIKPAGGNGQSLAIKWLDVGPNVGVIF